MTLASCAACGQSVSVVISVADAAQRLGISRRVAYELIEAGRLPHVRLNGRFNGRLVLHWPTVEEWLRAESLDSVAPAARRRPSLRNAAS